MNMILMVFNYNRVETCSQISNIKIMKDSCVGIKWKFQMLQ